MSGAQSSWERGQEGKLMEHQMGSLFLQGSFGGFLQWVTMVWVSGLHLYSHSGWSQEKAQLTKWNFSPFSFLFTEHI
jgi:hypothetical protein